MSHVRFHEQITVLNCEMPVLGYVFPMLIFSECLLVTHNILNCILKMYNIQCNIIYILFYYLYNIYLDIRSRFWYVHSYNPIICITLCPLQFTFPSCDKIFLYNFLIMMDCLPLKIVNSIVVFLMPFHVCVKSNILDCENAKKYLNYKNCIYSTNIY